MSTDKDVPRQLQKLSERIEKIESRLGGLGVARNMRVSTFETVKHCSMPAVPERVFARDVSEHRQRLLRYIGRKWANGTKLRFAFLDNGPWAGPDAEKDLVRQGFEIWAGVGVGIKFQEVSSISEAEVRIGFEQTGRTWSFVGRDVIDVPGQSELTMNYGWRIAEDPRGVDVAVHEIGHTLGFPREHQNPFAGIVWDTEAVYDYFALQGWTHQDTDHNVLSKHSSGDVEGSAWDPDSIMHYAFPAGLIVKPAEYANGLTPDPGLSAVDIAEARKFYPAIDDSRNPRLVPYSAQHLNIAAGEQANFIIEPDETRDYTIQTFGQADVLLVLFEDQGGDLRFVAGDDDSATSLNARIVERLYPGRRYILRVRLYLNWAGGETAVMLW